jgi:pyruvate dehydrogenase E2 component (dihydrolipoamide acetyltransferase)
MIDFNLPELGENVSAGDVLRILVKPGDTVAKDQPVLELETDKATIEVPSSVAGQVKEIKVKAGDKVKVGQVILSVEDAKDTKGGATDTKDTKAPAPDTNDTKTSQAPAAAAAAGANTAAKVPAGEPGLEQHVEGEKRPSTPLGAGDAAADKSGVARPFQNRDRAVENASPQDNKVVDINRASRSGQDQNRGEGAAGAAGNNDAPPAPAAPSVRRMARELGVDISQVAGSGDAGRISVEDVKAHAKRLVSGAMRGGAAAEGVALPDFSRWGDIERQPMRAVRRKTAEHLSAVWASVPHVTQFDLADVTALEELRKKHAPEAKAAGGNLTVTAIAVKVVAAALRKFPQFNASIDMAAGEIVLKKFVNVGLAVDTDRGLLVPVIRNADQKNIIQISVELAQLSEKARNRKITLDEMQGGCFSISNLGGIGGTYFTPLINAPEVAILGISRASVQPRFENGGFVPRLMLPLSLSYDHRVIDGADGIRFLRWVAEALEQPFVIALNG